MIEQGRRLRTMDVQRAVIGATPVQHCESCHHLVRISFLLDGANQSFGICPVCGYAYLFVSPAVYTDWTYAPTLREIVDLRKFWLEIKAIVNAEAVEKGDLDYPQRVRLHCRDQVWCMGFGHVH
jgi:hypothetical protein